MVLSDEEKLLIGRMSVRAPILVLGAGFSRGVQNGKRQPLPDGQTLAQRLFDDVLSKSKKVDPDDLAEYRKDLLDLKKICDDLRLEKLVDKRDRYLKDQMSGCYCLSDDYHMWLRCYPWRYIFTLNIDDLVEFIYSDLPKKEQPLVHVKQYSVLDSDAAIELYKLHGSVSRPDLGYVFDSDEYRTYMAEPSWGLNAFATAFLSNDVVFLGTEFQEEDLLLMIERFQSLTKIIQPPHYFFVSPRIQNRKLKRMIRDERNMHAISWDTRRFLSVIKSEISDVRDVRRKMRDYGMIFYDEKFRESQPEAHRYLSELYLGAPPRPLDFFQNMDIPRPELVEKAEQLSGAGGHHLVAIYGDAYVGKTCAAIRLGVDLMQYGYEFSIFSLPYSMNATAYQGRILDYLSALPEGTKAAIMAEKMPYYYSHVKHVLENCPPNISSLVFICTGSVNDHGSKKYLLDCYPGLEEVFISEKTQDSRFANNIYDKLYETNHLNKLRSYGSSRRDCVSYIRQLNDLIDVLYTAQEGRQFVEYFSDLVNIKEESPSKTAFLILCCFSAMDISEISAALFIDIAARCGAALDVQKFYADYSDVIRMQGDRITLRCSRLLWVSAKRLLHKKDVVRWIQCTVHFLARNLREREETLQNEMFQKLIKVKNLRNQLALSNDSILALLLEIAPTCRHLSYYWVQRGILHRDMEHFEEANNALSEAAEIRNNTSYHVRHAQAKNYMTWGVWALEHEPSMALYYFEIGQKQIEELIEKASNRFFAYSTHTYVDMMMKYYQPSNTPMPEPALQYITQLLLSLPKVQNDRLGPDITRRFLSYCKAIPYQSADLIELQKMNPQKRNQILANQPTDFFDSDDFMDD